MRPFTLSLLTSAVLLATTTFAADTSSDRILQEALKSYPEGTPVVWVQDEPENMGAWRFLRIHFGERLFNHYPFTCVSRPASASPATGSQNAHKREQAKLLGEAFSQ